MTMPDQPALVTRGGRSLKSSSGGLPTIDQVRRTMVLIEGRDFEGIVVVTSFTGSPPETCQWVRTAELQESLEGEDMADRIGRALLCAA